MNRILILILSTTAIFTYCIGMTDTHILPKWLCTLGVVVVMGMIEVIISPVQRMRSEEERLLN